MAVIISVVISFILVGADQIFKYLVVEYVEPVEQITLIENVFRLRYVENTGAVFGSFAAHTSLLTFLSILLLGLVVYFYVVNANQSKYVSMCLILMFSGGIGNVIDRIRLRYVIDYIEPLFVEFAVFNFADILVTVGAFLLIIYLCIDLYKDYLFRRKVAQRQKLRSESNDGKD